MNSINFLSIIIIGQNEGWKLTNCIRSTIETISYNDIIEYEIIYVDSKSTDDSIERVKKFPEIKILQLTADCNAAIARNVGATEAKGQILFFLDGDMEIIPEAFKKFYCKNNGIAHSFLSGNLLYYYYDNNWKLERKSKTPQIKIEEDTYQTKVGGMFFIYKQLWEDVNGMKCYLDLGEDPDLAFRLARRNIYLLRRKDVLVVHHTIDYLSNQRKWRSLVKVALNKAILYRENLFNIHAIKMTIMHEYSLFVLVFVLSGVILCDNFNVVTIYLVMIIIRALRNRKYLFSNILFYPCRDIALIIAFIFYYPKNKNIRFSTIH